MIETLRNPFADCGFSGLAVASGFSGRGVVSALACRDVYIHMNIFKEYVIAGKLYVRTHI